MNALAFRHAETDDEIAACFPLLRQLRPRLVDAAELLTRVRRQQAQGYRLLVGWQRQDAVGAAGYRVQENLIRGRFVYVDDLVVLDTERRRGIGAELLDRVAGLATESQCASIVLDTALDNALGQRFYFRSGMLATALHFAKTLA